MRSIKLPLWLEISLGVLVILVLSNAVTLVIAEQQRLSAVHAERLGLLQGRLSAFVALYRQLPSDGREKLIDLASARYEKFSVGRNPRVKFEAERDRRIETRLREALMPLGVRDVHVAKRGRPALMLFGPWRRGSVERFSVAVALGPSEWANVDYYWPIGESAVPGLLFSAVVSGVLLVLLSAWIGMRLSKPLQALASASLQMQTGKKILPVPAHGPEIVKAAVASFNGMAQRVMPLMESQRVVLASVGHDLRSPITSLRLKSEFIDDVALRQQIHGSLDELQALTEAALHAVKNGVGDEAVRVVQLGALLEALCEDLRDRGSVIRFDEFPHLEVACRPNEIKRAVRNLVENAVRYGSEAFVSMRRVGRQVEIVVDDKGAGIAVGDLERVFVPFVRLNESTVAGHGLGLTLSRAIARAHGGDVRLENLSSGGLRAMLSIAI